jgi:non-heme chloroperoxidase
MWTIISFLKHLVLPFPKKLKGFISSKSEPVPCLEVSDGCKLNYVEWGSGRPVIFLHGRGGSVEFFTYQTTELSKHFRVLAYDARGHGNSDKPNSLYNHDEYARDLKDFMDKLGLDSVNLAGASTGSFVIQNYVKLFGLSRVNSITLISSTPVFSAKPDFPYAFSRDGFVEIEAKLKSDFPKAVADFTRFLFHKEPSGETLNWLVTLSLKTPLHVLLKTLHSNVNMDYRDVLPRLGEKPVLIAHGKQDKLCPFEAARFLSEKIPSSRLEAFENSGHCLYIEEHEKMNIVLRDFLLTGN